ncbi:Quinone oxidoreductase-like protein 1 [Gryllus bimaculatus]|nr:Quinone oxidoreductase-like protein 1 [Gryllus bimaculatus]
MPKPRFAKSISCEVKGHDGIQIISDKVNLPEIEGNSVLVEVKACGLLSCHYDNSALFQLLTKAKKNQRIGVGCDIAGIVLAVGPEVTTLCVGAAVVGVVPLDYEQSGCSDFVVLEEFDVAPKPDGVSFVEAAACIGDAVKAYTALHYLGRLTSGDTVLILNGASPFGSVCIQLAHHWGAKILTTSCTEEEKSLLLQLNIEALHIIELNQKNSSLKSLVMLETGNLGVDIIVDQGLMQFCQQNIISDSDNRLSSVKYFPTKHDVISCLAVGGRWVTSRADMQLDPPNSRLLYLRCATLGFLFEQAWMMSNAQQGRYQHILMDIMEKVASGIVRPNVHKVISFETVLEFVKSGEGTKGYKIVMARE